MGIEVLGANTATEQVKILGSDDASLSKVDSKTRPASELGVEEPVKFGLVDNLHGTNGETKETNHSAASNIPKDAVDEWPAPKQIHTFYCIKFRSYEDPKIRAKVEQAEKDLQKKNQARFHITEALKAKRSERANVISQLKPLTSEDKQYRMVIDEKRKEMEPLTAALGKLRSTNSTSRDKGVIVCSSEEELDDLIHSLHYRIQHESNTLVEEKQLLKEIKQLESTREKVIANAAMRVKIQDSLGQKEAIQDQVKLIGVDMDGVRKDQQTVRTKIKHLEEELKAIDDKISSLQEELAAVTEKRDKAYETLSELRKARDTANAPFYQNRSLLNNVKVLAAKKNITAVEELCHNEVEKFMTDWSSSKAFRDDYERRILPSLDIRQLSRDGRMRNPDEKPIISEAQPANELESEPSKMAAKRVKEDVVPPPLHDTVAARKPQEEVNILTGAEQKGKSRHVEDREDTYEIGKAQELLKGKEIDPAKLREIKREEELAKAKLAMERKKKLAEKAAAKAEARAQKEAEKRMKEKEKRAKKKSGIQPILSTEQDNTDAKSVEPEETEVKSDGPVPANAKEQKEKIRYRGRAKVSDSLPKVILKRKKSHSYWSWAAPAAILAVAFALVGWYYFVMN